MSDEHSSDGVAEHGDDESGADVAPTAEPVEAPARQVDHEIIGQVVKGSEPVHGIRNAEAEDPPE